MSYIPLVSPGCSSIEACPETPPKNRCSSSVSDPQCQVTCSALGGGKALVCEDHQGCNQYSFKPKKNSNKFHLRWKSTWTPAPRLDPHQSETFAKDFWNGLHGFQFFDRCANKTIKRAAHLCSRVNLLKVALVHEDVQLDLVLLQPGFNSNGENISGRNIFLTSTFWMRMTTMAGPNIDYATAED